MRAVFWGWLFVAARCTLVEALWPMLYHSPLPGGHPLQAQQADQAELERRLAEEEASRASHASLAQRAWHALLRLCALFLAGLAAAFRALRHDVARLADRLAGFAEDAGSEGVAQIDSKAAAAARAAAGPSAADGVAVAHAAARPSTG